MVHVVFFLSHIREQNTTNVLQQIIMVLHGVQQQMISQPGRGVDWRIRYSYRRSGRAKPTLGPGVPIYSNIRWSVIYMLKGPHICSQKRVFQEESREYLFILFANMGKLW